MAQRYAAAVRVRALGRELEIACDGDRLRGEGLVQLDEIDVGELDARALEQAAHGGHRADAHVTRLDARVGVTGEAGHRLQSECLRAFRRHQHHRCRGVVDARGVAGGDATLRIEGGRQLRERFHGRVAAHVLVRGKHRRALPRAHGDGKDLRLEPAVVDRARGAAVALERGCILLLARDAPLRRDVLGRHAHVAVVEGIRERAHHGVEELAVAHALPEAHRRRPVRDAAHALGAARDRAVGVTRRDDLRRGDDRLQPAAAEAVHGQRGRFDGESGAHARDAREVHVARLGVDHVAEDDVPDFGRLDAGALHGFGDARRCEIHERLILEGAAVAADRGPDAAQEDDVTRAAHSADLARACAG